MAWYHQWTARILESIPGLYEWVTLKSAGNIPTSVPVTPWTQGPQNPFDRSTMFVTTGGVHTPDQTPFDMSDSRGDTSHRWIPKDQKDFQITHDYYDHSDADEDINCLFPLPLARKLSRINLIGPLTNRHLSFMGHIEDPLLPELMDEQLPKVWNQMNDCPESVVLSPG
ncbi:MAG: hypothetical protein ABEJ65_01855 [bacterium]